MELLGIWILFGIVSAFVAVNKGRNGCGWLILGFLLGPFGLILSLVASKNGPVLEKQVLASGDMKKCPYCAELVRAEAKVCRYCQRDLPMPESSEIITTPDKLAKNEQEQRASDLKPKGTCPNCNEVISLDSESCPKCQASFAAGSAWKIRPLRKR